MLTEAADHAVDAADTKLSVIIPCRNELTTLPRLLDALVHQQEAPAFEVIVVDGSSDDGTRELLEEWSNRKLPFVLTVIDNPKRIIPCALNLGVRRAKARRIIRLDAHGEVASDHLRVLHDSWVACGADVVGPHIRMIPDGDGWWARINALMLTNPVGNGGLASRRHLTQPHKVEHVVMNCFTRETWDAVGGFDEGMLVNEDFDFDWRAGRLGRRVMALPKPDYALRARATLKGLAIQRWRYGWWKAVTLRRHPASLRLRQVAPLAMMVVLPTSAMIHAATPLLLIAGWSAAMLVASTPMRLRAAGFTWWTWPFALICVLPAAALSQVCWALGCWAGLLLRARPRQTAAGI